MPVSFLAEEQERRYGRYAGEPSPEQLARYFHLADADRAFAGERRGGHMRLGCAVQFGTVRFLGTFLENPADVPPRAVRYLADQVGVVPDDLLAEYAASRWRWQHPAEIRERYGYRPFSDPLVQFRLNRWLYALCWTGSDRPSALFDRATAWLVARKVLLPGASTLDRNVARVRARAAQRLWRQIGAGLVLQSSAELARAVARLDEVRGLAAGLPRTDRLSRSRVLALARFAAAAKASAVARLPEGRRLATLVAFVCTLEATAQDDVLDLFDIVVTRIFADAQAKGREARMRNLRDLDAAALTLRNGWGLLLGQGAGADRGGVFAALPREEIEAAMARVAALVRPPEDPYFDELLSQYGRIRQIAARPDARGAPGRRPGGPACARRRAAPARGGTPEGQAAQAAHRVRAAGLAQPCRPRRTRRSGSLDFVPGGADARGAAPARPLCQPQPTLRRSACRAAGRRGMGGGPPRRVPHPGRLGQRGRGDRAHGELRQRYREGQEDQLGALGLVVNVIVLWNTIYMDAALDQLRAEGFDVRDEDMARLSPLGHEHVNMLGRYAFTLPETVARGELRPLRDPRSASDEPEEPALT